ncbi:hypothetical protein [Bradyrhizobium sp. Ce-3]|nr:hypothetical protein [Bradyrhizobium sp. Ce-3]
MAAISWNVTLGTEGTSAASSFENRSTPLPVRSAAQLLITVAGRQA